MNKKKISRIIAGALAANVALSTLSDAKTVSALELSDVSTSSNDKPNSSDSSNESGELSNSGVDSKKTLNGVSVEQMQSDFESVANNAGNSNEGISLYSEESDDGSTNNSVVDNHDSSADSSDYAQDTSIYLSDLTYDSLSYLQWKAVKINKSSSGDNIHLLVNGKEKVFTKGIGVDTDAQVVYDISQYSKTHTHLVGYLGVDYRQNGKGDGVDFTIETSQDGETWKTIDDVGVKKASNEAYMVYVKVEGAKYVRLSAMCGPNDNRSYDHAVFANIRLVDSSYDPSTEESYNGFMTVTQYDEIISKRSVEENYDSYKQQVLEREFVRRIGYDTISSLINTQPGVKEALNWLFSDFNSLEMFIQAGDYFSGTGYNALLALGKLYNEFKGDLGNLQYKKMLLATAAAYSKDLKPFMVDYGGNCVGANPVETYKNFKKLYDEDRFVRKSEFENYNMELVRAVMDARINYDEMIWLRDYIDKKYPPDTSLSDWKRYNGYGYAGYVNTGYGQSRFYSEENKDTWNKKYGFLDYGISYGNTNLYRAWMFMEAGAICWGLSGLGMVVNELQGIPAIGTYQPGHEAYLLYSVNSQGKGIWSISDDIGGWQSSFTRWGNTIQTEHRLPLGWGQMEYNTLNKSGYANNTSYILLAQDAMNDYSNYMKSFYYNLIANSYDVGSEEYKKALDLSLESYDKNLDSIYAKFKMYKLDSSTTDKQWFEFAQMVADKYTYYPAPMVDLLDLIRAQMSDSTLKATVDIIETSTLTKASVATPAQSLQNSACQKVAKSLLGQATTPLASFSFDGENANKIIINESYDNSTIQIRVSLDGGNTWEKFEDGKEFTINHVIELSDEQVKKINSTDDILVGLMGTEENYTIDIKDGSKITTSVLYKNDEENKLFGNISNLEYSEDGVNWYTYTSDIRFPSTEDRVIKFRYKAYGVYLQGPSDQFTFKADKDTDTKKYITIDHLSLAGFSTELSSDKASNVLNGNGNNGWHADGGKEDTLSDSRYLIVKLDKVRYISALEYYSAYNNGKVKNGTVYTSLDGVNWTEAGKATGWDNSATFKTIDLTKSMPARYVKFVGNETYGSPIMSCRILNLYEDTTQEYKAEAKIDYVTSDDKLTVTAKLVLPEGCNVVGDSEHVFDRNGKFIFKFTDANGVEQSITAEVNNIDENLPRMDYEFDYPSITNKDVTLTVNSFSKEGVSVVEVDENPSFDEHGNYIIKGDSSSSTDSEEIVVFSDDSADSNDLTDFSDSNYSGDAIESTKTLYSYKFEKNKTVVFILEDSAGVRNYIPVTVDWIDKEAPEFDIVFDVEDPTYDPVIATVTGLGEGETVISEGGGTHKFTKNGEHEFIVTDEAGNITKKIAKVTWIRENSSDKDENLDSDYGIEDTRDFEVEFNYDYLTNQDVTATLIGLDSTDKVVSQGGETHTFVKNGQFTFVIEDKYGNQFEKIVKVDWIDKDAPVFEINYSTEEPTYDEVVVTIVGVKDDEEIISDGGDTHVFTKNGRHTFKVKDKAGNVTEKVAEVTWIRENSSDKDENLDPDYGIEDTRDFEVKFNYDKWTNQNVIATIEGLDTSDQVISDGGNSHEFDTNGKFTFVIRDKYGNEFNKEVEVNWIDKDAPTANIALDYSKAHEGIVIARLTNVSEKIEITTAEKLDYHEFKTNGNYTFTFVDEAGNTGEVTANVDWFKFEEITSMVSYDEVFENESVDSEPNKVIATVDIDEEKMEVLNNNGSNKVTFIKNGVFHLKVRMRDSGEEFYVMVEVNSLSETADEDESPVLPPSVEDGSTDTDDSTNDGNLGGDNSTDQNNPVVPPVVGGDGSDNGSISDGSIEQAPVEDGENTSNDGDLDNSTADDSSIGDADVSNDSDSDLSNGSDIVTVAPPVTTPPVTNLDNGNTGSGGNVSGSGSSSEGNSGNGNSGNGYGNSSNNSFSNVGLNSNNIASNNLNSNNNSIGFNGSYNERLEESDSNKESNVTHNDEEANRESETNSSSDLTNSENSSKGSVEEDNSQENKVNKGVVATVIATTTASLSVLYVWLRRLFGLKK
ncbi:discoidin domain-containing protein [Clostridium sp. Sa3CUN1]|uniref:Discoidin domain-containing protein n=1 Tax=Clostridium gallinarum TaxID=2762246 RepID=A0ABR8Q3C6_9CLOT|nr:discoidin domain-containing protein [Clostridium gallinarum]MBD7914920.1 discoidin domain-containing protein [Clostridium gallinarum]